LGLNLLAIFWGFAAATLFFVVPDVLLSVVALRARCIFLALGWIALCALYWSHSL
jgi:hypothetical protein